MTETRRNFLRGGIRGFFIPVYTQVQDFPAIPAGTEWYLQLWSKLVHLYSKSWT